jgi:hypothetical protein
MKKHQVSISTQFVRNVKRMWDSPFAAYKEIIQNALRAGAKTIRVTYQDDQLTVEDDGRGFTDLDSLLVIGESDWGEDVIEPAGVGIYAAPAFADQVTIQSGTRVLILSSSLYETGQVEEQPSKEYVSGTRVIVDGIKLDSLRIDKLRGYVEADFYFNGDLIPHPLEGMDFIDAPYGRLYLEHYAEYPWSPYSYHASMVWEGYALDSRFVSLPGIWVVDPKVVPGELRPQLPHRDRLIKNETYERVIKEINDYFDDWAVTKLSSIDIKVMPGRGKYEKIANQLEKEFTPELVPGALVMKAREHFYTQLAVPMLEYPEISWEGAFGYVDDLEKEKIYTRNDLVLKVSLHCREYEDFLQMLVNAQVEQPLLISYVDKKRQSNLKPINLHQEDGGWYCDGWELDGGYLRGLEVMIWPTKDGERIVFSGNPAVIAQHALKNAELWSLALTHFYDTTLSQYWGEDGSSFGVLPGEVLTDVYRAVGKREQDASTYVKLQQVKKVLTEYGLPEEYRKIALTHFDAMEKSICAAGYIPPKNARSIHTF